MVQPLVPRWAPGSFLARLPAEQCAGLLSLGVVRQFEAGRRLLLLGELAALTGNPRIATATACGRVVSRVLTGAEFHRFMRRYPDAALNMAAAMGDRLQWSNERRTDFAAYPAEVRLARLLVEIARKCGRRTEEGISIGIALSQPELATMVGVSEATVQKAFKELRGNGVLRTGYRRISVLDLPALRAYGAGADDWPTMTG
ncbi:MAG: Crp/Fnr family transcriptional regulator [Actinobacteria bacterium]|nr:MAG: Crp/Fnr family transcriptional regulator [Actinomycetota bacterium]